MSTAPTPESQSIGQRAATGGGWSFAMRLSIQLLSLAQIAILARLLTPEAFGVMGVALLAHQAISVFVFTGFESALVQAPTIDEDDLHTVWWAGLIRQTLVGMVLALLAHPIATLYRIPASYPVLLAFAALQPFYGLINPTPQIWARNLQFRSVYFFFVGSTVVGLCVGIGVGLVRRDVWALVASNFAMILTQVVLSYRMDAYRPRLRVSRAALRRFASFGRWMLGATVGWFFYSQSASAFAGWMFGATALGYYQIASRFALLASSQLGDTVLSAAFPAYAQIQHDRERVRRAFLRVLSLAFFLIAGVTVGVALGLPRLLVVLLGGQWESAAPLVPALALAGGGVALLRVGEPLYMATGLPRFLFWMNSVQAMATVALLYPLGRLFGLAGIPWAMCGAVLASLPLWWWGIRQASGATLGDVVRVVGPSLLAAAIMAVAFFFGGALTTDMDGILGLFGHLSLLLLASLAYLLVVWGAHRLLPAPNPLSEMQQLHALFWQRLQPAVWRLRRRLSTS